MDPDELASADDLWWSWAVLIDTGRLPEGARSTLDPDNHLLTYHYGDSWLVMQRLGGGRAVVWGHVADARIDAVTEHVDVLDGAPDWASSDAVWRSIRERHPGFFAWHTRDGWDTTTPGFLDSAFGLIEPLLRGDPRDVAAARAGLTDSPLLRLARGVAQASAQGAVRKRLRGQIHQQMRDTVDRPRNLPTRPVLLARWARIAEPAIGFRHVVLVREGDLVPEPGNTDLPHAHAASLANVLLELHRDEAAEESGGWLVARVRYDGPRLTLDRAFDSLPAWYAGRGPTLRTLSWEMAQRAPAWRPAWASLLPG